MYGLWPTTSDHWSSRSKEISRCDQYVGFRLGRTRADRLCYALAHLTKCPGRARSTPKKAEGSYE
jgi:hypothetical protein